MITGAGKAKKTTADQKENAELAAVEAAVPARKRKANKNIDGAYNPRQSSAPRDYKPNLPGLLKLMGAYASPDHSVVISSRVDPDANDNDTFLSPEVKMVKPRAESSTPVKTPTRKALIFSSPLNGPRSSSVVTPRNHSRYNVSSVIHTETTEVRVYIPENKCVAAKRWVIGVPHPNIANSPVPVADMNGIENFELTAACFEAVDSVRSISQNHLAGISANNAVALAGIDAEPKEANWCHFFPHAAGGKASQTIANLGIGTKYSNAKMELVNRALADLYRKKQIGKLCFSALPEWEPGFERIRLLRSIRVIISNGPYKTATNFAEFSFDMQSREKVCESEIKHYNDILVEKFASKKKISYGLSS
jgi:hypothetical protein